MEIQLLNGKWQMNGKTYFELLGVEKQIFEVLLAVEQIMKKYNL